LLTRGVEVKGLSLFPLALSLSSPPAPFPSRVKLKLRDGFDVRKRATGPLCRHKRRGWTGGEVRARKRFIFLDLEG